jgi:hypothetical protein
VTAAGGGTADVTTVGATGFSGGGGVTTRGGGPLTGAAGTAGFATGTAGGFTSGSVGGRGGLAGCGGAAACCLPIIALSTSPGLEICDRSIFVLMLSASGREARGDFPAPEASPEARKCTRTFSASWSSSELECVFFSVTPTSASASRMALLLTSSSLARSLIRTLLIRLFVPPDFSR